MPFYLSDLLVMDWKGLITILFFIAIAVVGFMLVLFSRGC